MDVRFKQHPGVGGPGQWTYATLAEFLFKLPYLFILGSTEQAIPPLTVLNEILKSGNWDAGMSGGCEWKPFEIPEQEYDKLVQALMARPEYRFVIDADLANIKSLRTRRGKALSKYSPRRRKPDA